MCYILIGGVDARFKTVPVSFPSYDGELKISSQIGYWEYRHPIFVEECNFTYEKEK